MTTLKIAVLERETLVNRPFAFDFAHSLREFGSIESADTAACIAGADVVITNKIMIDAGMITQEQAAYHPHRNVITRAVGGAENLYLEVRVFTVKAGDWYILCSDGFYNELTEETIASHLIQESPEKSVQILMEKALAKGALDNVTLIVIKINEA